MPVVLLFASLQNVFSLHLIDMYVPRERLSFLPYFALITFAARTKRVP